MFCRNCGTKRVENAAFCGGCGAAIPSNVAVQEPAPPPVYEVPYTWPEEPAAAQPPTYEMPYPYAWEEPAAEVPERRQRGGLIALIIILPLLLLGGVFAVWQLGLFGFGIDESYGEPQEIAEDDMADAPEAPEMEEQYQVTEPSASARTLTIYFDTGGESITLTIEEGDTIGDLIRPEREGFTFRDWTSDPAGVHVFAPDTPITGDMELFAQWERDAD